MTTVALITLFASGLTFVLFGQVVAAWSAVGQGGAIASLCWAVYHLLSHTLPEQRDAFVETLAGLDERQHQDSVTLNETLQELRANCAARAVARRPRRTKLTPSTRRTCIKERRTRLNDSGSDDAGGPPSSPKYALNRLAASFRISGFLQKQNRAKFRGASVCDG